MNVYIWQYVNKVSSSYHEGGGAVAFAATEDRARELLNAIAGCDIKPDEKPDVVQAMVDGGPEHAMVFPDAGCC